MGSLAGARCDCTCCILMAEEPESDAGVVRGVNGTHNKGAPSS